MKNSLIAPFAGLWFVLGISLTAAPVFAQDWITAPQLCRGKPYSETARAAEWRFDQDRRVSLATKDSRTMYASVFPGHHSDFVVNVRVRLEPGAECRLALDKSTFDLTNSGTQTQLVAGGEERAVDNVTENDRLWTLLTIRRRGQLLSVSINGQHTHDLEVDSRAISSIGLQAKRGTIAVSNFALTGELERRNPSK